MLFIPAIIEAFMADPRNECYRKLHIQASVSHQTARIQIARVWMLGVDAVARFRVLCFRVLGFRVVLRRPLYEGLLRTAG